MADMAGGAGWVGAVISKFIQRNMGVAKVFYPRIAEAVVALCFPTAAKPGAD